MDGQCGMMVMLLPVYRWVAHSGDKKVACKVPRRGALRYYSYHRVHTERSGDKTKESREFSLLGGEQSVNTSKRPFLLRSLPSLSILC